MIPIAPHITAWLRTRLPLERAASPHTCDAYAYAFRLLLNFASQRLGVAPSALALEQMDAPLILAFLEHLQQARGNGARSRNARLAAIRSFMRFIEHREPAALDQIRRVLAIPMQRVDVEPVRHLEAAEVQAVLDAPDPQTRAGIRDRALLHFAVTSGVRVSELVSMRLADITFRDNYMDVRIRGKGRKDRVLTVWKAVGDSVRAWLAVRGELRVPELFVTRRPRERRGQGGATSTSDRATAEEVATGVVSDETSAEVAVRHGVDGSGSRGANQDDMGCLRGRAGGGFRGGLAKARLSSGLWWTPIRHSFCEPLASTPGRLSSGMRAATVHRLLVTPVRTAFAVAGPGRRSRSSSGAPDRSRCRSGGARGSGHS